MEILVTYDVSTETASGRKRLRRVARLCEAHGQRVQKSVFECILDQAQLETLLHKLAGEINETEDTLRVYRLQEPRERYVKVLGQKPAFDLHGSLVV
jgi:CRISPR-associated protein Cas2